MRAILGRLVELERKVGRMMVPATVSERDHKKGVRFEFDKDENGDPVKSGWVQPPDWNKGRRSRLLPDVGSQALVFTPPGHETSSSFVPMSHHENSENPAANADQTVLFDDGTNRIQIEGGGIKISSGGSSILIADGKIELSSDLVKAIGASLKHNAKEVGDNHEHTDVMPGGALTGPPA